jgi:hypothetical protein
MNSWKLAGYDTFDGHFYKIEGTYGTEADAIKAAQERLVELDHLQPIECSGGQPPFGIQDMVYVVRPDGSMYRFGTTEKEECSYTKVFGSHEQ